MSRSAKLTAYYGAALALLSCLFAFSELLPVWLFESADASSNTIESASAGNASSLSLELHILNQFKLPVLLTALSVGACIAAASASLQVLLRNPLADPSIIGVSSGASLMAAAVFLLGASPLVLGLSNGPLIAQLLNDYQIYLLPLLCFVGALLSSFLIFSMARLMGGAVSSVILAGIAISTLCSALIAWMFLVAPANQFQNLSFWLMGSLYNSNWQILSLSLPIMAIAFTLLMLNRGKLNQLYLGEQNAQLSGLDTKRFQNVMLMLIALLVGVSVSIAGSIAFLGLLVPHFIRRIHGNDNRFVLPLSAIVGAAVLLFCAVINSQLDSIILPISLLTASIGAPLFIYVMLKQRPI